MVRRKGLGRGLESLLPAAVEPRPGVQDLRLADLLPNRHQPRQRFDESDLEELTQSIRSQGVIQPLIVTPAADGRFTIVAGERRWRAARRAGLQSVPAVVREVEGSQQLLELALVENLQRTDLNPVEEAEAFAALQAEFSLSQEEIGTRLGRSRAAVANSLRLLNLAPDVLDFLRSGELTPGQVRPLLALHAKEHGRLAKKILEEGWSARRVEAHLRGKRAAGKPRTAKRKDANTRAAEDALTRHLQTEVEIRRRGRGGMVAVHFGSEEELMRVFELLYPGGTL